MKHMRPIYKKTSAGNIRDLTGDVRELPRGCFHIGTQMREFCQASRPSGMVGCEEECSLYIYVEVHRREPT